MSHFSDALIANSCSLAGPKTRHPVVWHHSNLINKINYWEKIIQKWQDDEKCCLLLSLSVTSGILYKGDGENVFLSQLPPVISTIMGNGRRRSISCPSCNGQAEGNKLLAPVALSWGIDGSLYVGDFNYIRRIYPSGNVSSVMELRWVRQMGDYKHYSGFSITGTRHGLQNIWREILKWNCKNILKSTAASRDHYFFKVLDMTRGSPHLGLTGILPIPCHFYLLRIYFSTQTITQTVKKTLWNWCWSLSWIV